MSSAPDEPVPASGASARQTLERYGASGSVVDELLVYGEPLLAPGREIAPLPLPDEPQLEAWSRYAADAASHGAFAALAEVFPQLRYPVRKGISETDGYLAATRRGEAAEDDEATGLTLARRDLFTLEIAPTIAGRIPLLVVGERADFESVVRAFSARNEPVDVPASMGACLVKGLNDWDRVHVYRRALMEKNPFTDWNAEFNALVPQKELYQDRFIILSTGPYSGVPAAKAGFPEDEWRVLSLSVRREHEATHYLTLRAAGATRTNLVDELIADYVGLVRTFGRYREDLALLFLGLEEFPVYREGGRLQNYRGKLSDEAFAVARRLAFDTVKRLSRLDLAHPARGEAGLAAAVLALASFRLDELATTDLVPRAREAARRGRVTTVEFTNDEEGLEIARHALDAFAETHRLAPRAVTDLELVLDEVVSNDIKYAWKVRGAHTIALEMSAADGAVTLEFVNDAPPFDALARSEPDTSSSLKEKPIGGLGILLVKRLTDQQQYARTGGTNRLRLTKKV